MTSGTLAFQHLRNIANGPGVFGDVFTDCAITACSCRDKPALLVAQRQRQSIDLRLCRHGKRSIGIHFQEPADALGKIPDVFVRKRVVQ